MDCRERDGISNLSNLHMRLIAHFAPTVAVFVQRGATSSFLVLRAAVAVQLQAGRGRFISIGNSS